MDICDKFFLKIQVDSAKVPNTPAPEKGKVEERNGASLWARESKETNKTKQKKEQIFLTKVVGESEKNSWIRD